MPVTRTLNHRTTTQQQQQQQYIQEHPTMAGPVKMEGFASDAALPTDRSLYINSASIAVVGWGIYRAANIVLPPKLAAAGHKQFLTNISVVATLISNFANVANYYVQRNRVAFVRDKSRWNYFARHIALPVALVMETLVPLVYWPLRLFFIHLIMESIPANHKNPIPVSVDLAIHMFPFLFLWADHYLSGYGTAFALSKKKSWFIVTSLGLMYNRWLYYLIDLNKGQAFPYPFLGVPEPYRSVIFISMTSMTWGFFLAYQRYPPTGVANRGIRERRKLN